MQITDMNLEDIEKDFNLKPIKVNNKKVNLLDNVYSVGYCYFDLFDILDFENPIVHKIYIKTALEKYEAVYQVDSSTYSGGSGCPFVDENGYLIGVLFQNLKFETKDSYLQVPNTGFIISKYVILEILNVINKSYAEDKIPDFDKIKIFNFPNNEIDKIFNFTGLKPNF